MTTREDIKRWLDDRPEGATHMIVVCDTFDYGDFPVFVKKEQDVNIVVAQERSKDMQRVMEVYNLRKPLDEQLKKDRCFEL